MACCRICNRSAKTVSEVLALCPGCILSDSAQVRDRIEAVHARSRARFKLPQQAPRDAEGVQCRRCIRSCRIGPGHVGYCGVRGNDGGRLVGGDADSAVVQWYYDPLPTNCVADWVCPASGPAGYPAFTDTQGPEHGYFNLAVFYEACSFNCLFCQNWRFKHHSIAGPRHSAAALAAAALNRQTRCVCFFGGDPSCQIEHAVAAARQARRERSGSFLRVCWETNGSVSRRYLKQMAELSLESGGCIKFDLKAWDDRLHRALCGVSNRRTLANFSYLADWIVRRPDPPFLIASTLLVPGYVGSVEVFRIARFVAALDPDVPYALLAFHPGFEMRDLPTTSRQQAEESLEAARSAGLRRVRIGNQHLLH